MLKLPIQEEHVSVRRTYLLLMKALLDLLAEMPFEKISLTDICRVSMVSRSTFYRYFEDKYDLLHYCIKMYIEGLRPVEDLLYFRDMNSLRIFLTFLLSQAQENLAQYQKIYQVKQRLPPEDRDAAICLVYVKFLPYNAKILPGAGR